MRNEDWSQNKPKKKIQLFSCTFLSNLNLHRMSLWFSAFFYILRLLIFSRVNVPMTNSQLLLSVRILPRTRIQAISIQIRRSYYWFVNQAFDVEWVSHSLVPIMGRQRVIMDKMTMNLLSIQPSGSDTYKRLPDVYKYCIWPVILGCYVLLPKIVIR